MSGSGFRSAGMESLSLPLSQKRLDMTPCGMFLVLSTCRVSIYGSSSTQSTSNFFRSTVSSA